MGAMVKMMVVMVVVAAVITAAMGGEVYIVGDRAGWTSIGHVDYKTWASTKLFRVGDTIVFSYNEIFHDVARVSYTDFITCNGSNPITTFTSGNDSFPIKYPGHYFFICTQSTHCKSGQKVDIRVPISAVHTAPTPTPLQPLPFPYPQPYAPAPSQVTPSPAPVQAPPVSQSPAPVPSGSVESLAPAGSNESPGPSGSGESPAESPVENAQSQQKNMAGQLEFGVEIWSIMAVLFYVFGF